MMGKMQSPNSRIHPGLGLKQFCCTLGTGKTLEVGYPAGEVEVRLGEMGECSS